MTEALVVGGTLAFGGLIIWLVMKAAEAKGAAKEQAAEARRDADATRKAGAVIAEHRSPDDAVGRLQRGDF